MEVLKNGVTAGKNKAKIHQTNVQPSRGAAQGGSAHRPLHLPAVVATCAFVGVKGAVVVVGHWSPVMHWPLSMNMPGAVHSY